MKQALCLLLLALTSFAHAQQIKPELKELLDATITRTQEISYYTSEVDWDKLTAAVHAKVEGAQELDDLVPAFETLLNTLRDHHGRILKLPAHSILANFTDHEKARYSDTRPRDPDTWAIVNDTESRFESELLPGSVGYLKVVGVGPNVDGQKEAERIRRAVVELAEEEQVEGWILDLRYNGGGNINVMLAGLAPLIDTKTVASVRTHDQQVQGTAQIKKGNFYYMDRNAFPIEQSTKLKRPKIAVLLSRWTVSSGELAAIAFKGQRNVRFFGEASGSYTTNTSYDRIGEQIAIVIATGVFCDRNGKAYDEHVLPDVEVAFDAGSDFEEDEGIQRAVEWLKE